jgi:hypothetical protein
MQRLRADLMVRVTQSRQAVIACNSEHTSPDNLLPSTFLALVPLRFLGVLKRYFRGGDRVVKRACTGDPVNFECANPMAARPMTVGV